MAASSGVGRGVHRPEDFAWEALKEALNKSVLDFSAPVRRNLSGSAAKLRSHEVSAYGRSEIQDGFIQKPLIYSAVPAAQGCAAKISGCKSLIL